MSKRSAFSMTITLVLIISLLGPISLRTNRLKTTCLLPNTYVSEVDLGKLTREEAEKKLGSWAREVLQKELTLAFHEEKWSIVPKDIIQINVKTSIDKAFNLCTSKSDVAWILSFIKLIKSKIRIEPDITFNEAEFSEKLSEVKTLTEVPPRNATFEVKGEEIAILKEEVGLTLDEKKLREDIIKALLGNTSTIEVPTKRVAALQTEEDLISMAIKVKAMEYSTTFDPGKIERTQNIKLASQAVSGYILPPDAVFSFNDVVGERTEEKGYKEAPIFYDNQVVPGVGGGICQLSSTIYNLALLSDLEIIERSNHSLPVDYVPLGRDATVNYGSIDLKFKNNTDGYLLLHCETKGNTLTAMFFGAKEFKDYIKLISETVKTIPPPVQTKRDNNLAKGEIRVISGDPGYEVRLWKVYDSGEDEIRQLVSVDVYQPTVTTIFEGAKEIEL